MKFSRKTPIATFWALVAVFLIILFGVFMGEWLMGPFFFLPAIGILFLLGAALLFFIYKSKIKSPLRKFLLLTGFSSAGFVLGVVLHNFFYALAILSENIIILKYAMEALHIAFFFIAIPICPIAFLIGAIGSAVLLVRQGKKEKPKEKKHKK